MKKNPEMKSTPGVSSDDTLIEKAKSILAENWTGSYTRPSPHLYPHQWNWDSGFIAIGYSRFDQTKAQTEIKTLFEAQWKTGMIPQIVYNPSKLEGYFPGPDFCGTERTKDAPEGKLTSGMTMPPIHATACRRIFENAQEPKKAEEFLKEIFPKLKRSHEYFYRYRDPKGEGLVYIRHPWESGMDNSPTWEDSLRAISIKKSELPEYPRVDLKKGIPIEQRPTDTEYDRYVWLIELFKKCGYREEVMDRECPFKVQDSLFNAVLSRANKDLVWIGDVIGKDTTEISNWAQKTDQAIQKKLWHEDHGIFDAYDLYHDRVIEVDTAAGFSPLFSQSATPSQADRMYHYLESASFCAMHQGNCFSIPNYNMQLEEFDPKNYWKGPIWININWMLYHGLLSYGFHEKVKSVMVDILELVRRIGFYEYYDPYDGTGYGTEGFSWTAALFIDTLCHMREMNETQKTTGG